MLVICAKLFFFRDTADKQNFTLLARQMTIQFVFQQQM